MATDVMRRALGSVLRKARYSALFLLAGSEALIVEWCLRAASGRSLGPAAGAALVVALAVLNVATLALLPRLARSTAGGYRLGRFWLVGKSRRRWKMRPRLRPSPAPPHRRPPRKRSPAEEDV